MPTKPGPELLPIHRCPICQTRITAAVATGPQGFPDVGKLRLCRSGDGGIRRLLGSPAGAKLLGRRLMAAEQIAGQLL